MKFPIIHKYFSINVILYFTIINSLIILLSFNFELLKPLVVNIFSYTTYEMLGNICDQYTFFIYKNFDINIYLICLIIIELAIRRILHIKKTFQPNISKKGQIVIYMITIILFIISFLQICKLYILLDAMKALDTW